MKVRNQAVAYVVRDRHLLVNIHAVDETPWDQAGLQVPAGGIEKNEAPDAAVLREVAEETGLEGVRIISYLGSQDYDMRPYADYILRRHFFHIEAESAPDDPWEHWERGGAEETRDDDAVLLKHYWLPLERCHALAAGQGALLGALLESLSDKVEPQD